MLLWIIVDKFEYKKKMYVSHWNKIKIKLKVNGKSYIRPKEL